MRNSRFVCGIDRFDVAKDHEKDDRLQFSLRPAALTRIGTGAGIASTPGWPDRIRGALLQMMKKMKRVPPAAAIPR
jgi:hypothetical protein